MTFAYFSSKKLFRSLLEISTKNHIFLKTFNSIHFQEIKIWFTDQKSQAIEIEEKINLTLIIR